MAASPPDQLHAATSIATLAETSRAADPPAQLAAAKSLLRRAGRALGVSKWAEAIGNLMPNATPDRAGGDTPRAAQALTPCPAAEQGLLEGPLEGGFS